MKGRVIISKSTWNPIRWSINIYCPHCGQIVSSSHDEILKIVSLRCRNCEKDFDVVTKTFD